MCKDPINNNNNNNNNNIIVDNPQFEYEHPTKGAYAEGLNECVVRNYKDVNIIYIKAKNVQLHLQMNLESSRSHAVFTIILKSIPKKVCSDCTFSRSCRFGTSEKSGATGERLKKVVILIIKSLK